MSDRDRPKGPELDRLVLWAIHALEAPVYTSDVQFYAALKVGRVGIDDNDPEFYKMIERSLDRCRATGVIEKDEFDGWRFTEIPQ